MGFLRGAAALAVLAVLAAAGFFWITAPPGLPRDMAQALASAVPDAQRGERIYLAAGCGSCHAAPEAEGEARLVLAGGMRFPSDFGTFLAPNISPSAAGIGGWSTADLALALTRGVSPEGRHYYPAFPYTSYIGMQPGDIADLKAYLDTLPASEAASLPHEVGFPFSYRRSLAIWKRMFLREGPVIADAPEPGRYLVEVLGHCGECHSPRNPLGAVDRNRWLSGAEIAGGQGRVPDITPAGLDWSQEDIAYYLESGFTPDFDSVGGHMAYIVDNYARLPAADRDAVAAYLANLPAGE
ncbi:cytochrome c [Mangrovicoccus algicola]|uniref:Cytochrome c n=1 Tax=Mangrovicoccus algicola TaxID=2771008 RepID=A0A8J6Z913_9RHOB|nr:cytochrome c [Mangrovicoccus algicola]MBE3638465.1 cytochrome c [Mangrovicoccus algicola]